MPNIPNMPDLPGGGLRQQKASDLRAKAEAEVRNQGTGAPDQPTPQAGQWHCVREGETLESIAADHNCSVEKIRAHPANAQLWETGAETDQPAPGDKIFIPTEDEHAPRPVGQGEHVVKQGECISSIAKNTGHFWETIWKDAANTELKEIRQCPNVLLPGDRVTIPEKRRKEEPRETEMRHRFVRRGEPGNFRLQLRDRWGNPFANRRYRIEVDGSEYEGHTDALGWLEQYIPGNAQSGTLTAWLGCNAEDEATCETWNLRLGQLDPAMETSGATQRLVNLGYSISPNASMEAAETREAIVQFQAHHGLRPTGRADDETCQKVKDAHAET